jgi:hypothetical protein
MLPIYTNLLLLFSLCTLVASVGFMTAGMLQDTNRPLADLIGFTTIGVTALVFLIASVYTVVKD